MVGKGHVSPEEGWEWDMCPFKQSKKRTCVPLSKIGKGHVSKAGKEHVSLGIMVKWDVCP